MCNTHNTLPALHTRAVVSVGRVHRCAVACHTPHSACRTQPMRHCATAVSLAHSHRCHVQHTQHTASTAHARCSVSREGARSEERRAGKARCMPHTAHATLRHCRFTGTLAPLPCATHTTHCQHCTRAL